MFTPHTEVCSMAVTVPGLAGLGRFSHVWLRIARRLWLCEPRLVLGLSEAGVASGNMLFSWWVAEAQERRQRFPITPKASGGNLSPAVISWLLFIRPLLKHKFHYSLASTGHSMFTKLTLNERILENSCEARMLKILKWHI